MLFSCILVLQEVPAIAHLIDEQFFPVFQETMVQQLAVFFLFGSAFEVFAHGRHQYHGNS
jgi:hypothetical protein